MAKTKSSKPIRLSATTVSIILAGIGLIGTLGVAYFNYRASIDQITIPINLTKTAQVVTLTPSTLLDITPTISSSLVPIETLSVVVYVYESPATEKSISEQSQNTFTKSSDINSESIYTHFYSFPEGDKKGAGIYFRFESELDLEVYDYQSVEFRLIKTNPTDEISISISDTNGNGNSLRIDKLINSEERGIKIDGDKYTISLEKNFPKARAIKFIYFWANPPFASGSIEYKVSGLSFVKP